MKIRDLVFILILALCSLSTAHADMDAYLNRLTAYAGADLGRFRADLGAHFGASAPEIDLALRTVSRHGDAALALWLSNRPSTSSCGNIRRARGRAGGRSSASSPARPISTLSSAATSAGIPTATIDATGETAIMAEMGGRVPIKAWERIKGRARARIDVTTNKERGMAKAMPRFK
jgi:hypothetical protein